jgi:hypothetical protein
MKRQVRTLVSSTLVLEMLRQPVGGTLAALIEHPGEAVRYRPPLPFFLRRFVRKTEAARSHEPPLLPDFVFDFSRKPAGAC